MTSVTTRRTRRLASSAAAAAAAAGLLLGLTGCATFSLGTPQSAPETQLPDRVGPDGCGVSSERVSALVNEALAEVGSVQESVLAGEAPDLSALLAPFETDLASLTEGITDPEVLAALEDVQAAFTGLGEIPVPANLLEGVGYAQEITAQIQALNDAGSALQQLCNAK